MMPNAQKNQRGVSLVITFFIMAVMLAVVLNISLILHSKVTIVANVGNSISAFYAAESGIEKTLYYDRKVIQGKQTRGFCNICASCKPTDCKNCVATSLTTSGSNGCDPVNCKNCKITYDSSFDGRDYSVDAMLTPYSQGSNVYTLSIDCKGSYKGTVRAAELNVTK